MIRTVIVPCKLNKQNCDDLNLASGRIYSGIVSRHWRLLKQKGLWLSEKSLTKLSDMRLAGRDLPMHAHSIDAAQQGFFKACVTTRAIRKAGDPTAHFPWRSKKFRTTIWKNTAIKFKGGKLELSSGRGNAPIKITLPDPLWSALKFVEVRLVFDKKARRYNWHIVLENGIAAKVAMGSTPNAWATQGHERVRGASLRSVLPTREYSRRVCVGNTISVDPGEIHPAVVGDEHESTIITCRERRHEMQGHAKRLAKLSAALSRKQRGSRAYRKLVRAKSRMKAKHDAVLRDMAHKISREIVNVAVEMQASTIVYGDTNGIGDGVDLGKKTNQKIAGWNHGRILNYVKYKAAAEGIAVVLQNERYTSQTCPNCGNRHKPRGRNYRCPSCRFQSHRDVVGAVNILSAYKFGEPGKIPAPLEVKHREPYSIRSTRSCGDTRQTTLSVVA